MLRPLLALTLALAFPVALRAQSSPCPGGQIFDDGTAELYPPYGHYVGGVPEFVARFTPPSYPYHYDQVCVNVESFVDVPAESFEVVVYDDDNPFRPGDPGTALASVPVQRDLHTTPEWVSVDLGCIVVNGGSVWIGVKLSGASVGIGMDTGSVHAYRFTAEYPIWDTSFMGQLGTLLVRALGAPGDTRALAQVRNGSGLNPLVYSADPPRIGSTWSARVHHSSVPAASATQIQIFARAATGPLVPQGELLIDLSSPRFFVSTHTSSSATDVHTVPIPSDLSLSGFTATSQALILAPHRIVLCNAVDLRIGC